MTKLHKCAAAVLGRKFVREGVLHVPSLFFVDAPSRGEAERLAQAEFSSRNPGVDIVWFKVEPVG